MNSMQSAEWPARLCDIETLDEALTRPSERLIEAARGWRSPLVLLGASGKMGPTLAVLAERAIRAAGASVEVLAVSRFSDAAARRWLEERGVRTLGCDLLDREAVARLPASENVIYLAGLKFGTAENPSLTWAVNTLIPANVSEHYRTSKIVAMSTGNVYPMGPVGRGGSVETDPLHPLGEYANAAIARERIFEYFARKQGNPLAILRLNYAVEMRYGVLIDIAGKVWRGEPIDATMGYLNCVWQGDANEMILRALSLAASPPAVFNLTGRETLSVRELAGWFGERFGKTPRITGAEAETALLSNPAKLYERLGLPSIPLEQVLQWTAAWVAEGGKTLGKPTGFQVRDGRF